jgi:hypothetical protein
MADLQGWLTLQLSVHINDITESYVFQSISYWTDIRYLGLWEANIISSTARVGVVVTLYIRSWEVLGSKPGRETEYSDGFFLFPPVPHVKAGIVLNLGHDRLFPKAAN